MSTNRDPRESPGTRVVRTTFAGLAEDQLRALVLGGQLAPGEHLNEVALADRLGISRGPLREAIQRLASEGLLAVTPHKGAYVRALNESELQDLYELRIAIETYAIRLGVERATTPQLEQLADTLAETGRALSTDEQGHYPSGLDVHLQLVGLAQNQVLLQAMHDTEAKLHLARARSAYDPDRARAAYEEHEAIVQHVKDRKAEAAARILEKHLLLSLRNALRWISGPDKA